MGDGVNLKDVVQSLLDGSLAEKLCRVCLLPLDDDAESVFARVCEDGKEYSVADCLAVTCGLQMSDSDDYSICSDCFKTATSAYKFHFQCKNSTTILELYIKEINDRLLILETNQEQVGESICITLPKFKLTDREVKCNVNESTTNYDDDLNNYTVDHNIEMETDDKVKDEQINETDKSLTLVSYGNGKDKAFHHDASSNLVVVPNEPQASDSDSDGPVTMNKDGTARKKRSRMEYRSCSQCPVKYRFISKLKVHMKTDHGIDLHICKICQYATEDESSYHNHLQSHAAVFTCAQCGISFKRRATLEAHVVRHDTTRVSHACTICGHVSTSEAKLLDHVEAKHQKRHTCFYCGKLYKGALSFERHIKRHEELINGSRSHQCPLCPESFPSALHLSSHRAAAHPAVACGRCDKTFSSPDQLRAHAKTHKKGFRCETCGRSFVDARALMWHQRLHTDERPYKCDQCGRAFVSAHRRDQHALCAHSAPARRCPLCPAAFHLASMVNAHIKKVHLSVHKRHRPRPRAPAPAAPAPAPAPVALQELSLALQDRVLELQTRAGVVEETY